MSDALKKRFWESASVVPMDGGFSVNLDDRTLKTPAKAPFLVPTETLAQAVADEWDALEEKIDPTRLPFTKLCNASIDNMAAKAGAVVDALAEYGETDLLCYRADSPKGLVEMQSRAWDPLLDWVRDRHGLFFVQTTGILPVAQPEITISSFRDWLNEMDKFQLMSCHDLVMLSGSIVIARAVVEGHVSAENGWNTSIIDDLWQEEKWGQDDEATALRDLKAKDFQTAARMMRFLNES